jgi:TRAP-type C4-dicarboxylate transport system permease small subunit
MVLFSSIYLTKNDQHLNTGLKLHQKLNKWQICLIDGVLALAISSIAVVITYQTAMFAFSAMSIEALALPWIKMGVVFIMLPIAMLSVFYYYIKNFLKNFGFIFKKN